MARLPVLFFLLFQLLSVTAMAQRLPPAYNLFNGKGKAVRYKKMLKAARDADVIVFGESHNDALGHWLQNELLRDLVALDDRPMSLGLEMLEVDQQEAVDQYLAGKISAEDLDQVGEGLWQNFRTDYEPAVRWAHERGLPIIATNVPRRHARTVFKKGFEGLEETLEESGKEFAPYPFPYDPAQKAYREMLEMMPGGHGGENFPKAQAIKDATMAWRIATTLPAGGRMLHLNGSFHSDYRQGIVWYLTQQWPELKVVTISTAEQLNVDTLAEDHEGKADFVFAIPASMTKTY